MTDLVLSEFVSSTGADPAIAQDILDTHEWDLQAALKAFSLLKTRGANEAESRQIARTRVIPIIQEESPREVPSRPALQKASAVEVPDEGGGEGTDFFLNNHSM